MQYCKILFFYKATHKHTAFFKKVLRFVRTRRHFVIFNTNLVYNFFNFFGSNLKSNILYKYIKLKVQMYHTWHNDIYWKKKKRCKNHIPPATIKKGGGTSNIYKIPLLICDAIRYSTFFSPSIYNCTAISTTW